MQTHVADNTPLAREAPSVVDDRAARLFVHLIWLAASVALLAYVGFYGRNVPYYEDWVLVPVLSGSRPFSLSWLVEMTVAEHRFILAKALLYPIWIAGGGDFRAAMFFSAGVLITIALACIAVARRLRGHAVFADGFFPLTLLSVSHGENVLFFAQVFFVAPMTLLTVIILLIADGQWVRRGGFCALLAICVMLMPLNGGIGLLYVPPLVAWCALAATVRWRSATAAGRRDAALLFGAIGVTLLLTGLYFVGYHASHAAAEVRTWADVGRTIIQVFSLGFGAGGHYLWPWLGSAVAAMCLFTAFALCAVAVTRHEDSLRAAGLLACLVAACMVPVAIGYGRAAIGPDAGLPARYALLVAPALACAYLTAVLYGGRLTGRSAQAVLFVAACAMLGPNVTTGIDYAKYRASIADAVLADINAGLPSQTLARRHARKLLPDNAELGERFEMLRKASLGPFAGIAANGAEPGLREIPTPINIVGAHDAEIAGGIVRGVGPDPYIVLSLGPPRYVAGIRVRFTLETEKGGPGELQAFWMLVGHSNFDAQVRNVTLDVESGPREQTVTFWVRDTVDHLRLDPDGGASVFRPMEIVLLAKE